MFVLNTNQSSQSLADKLWLTVIPFFFNQSTIPAWGFEDNPKKKLGDKKFQGIFSPKLLPLTSDNADTITTLRFKSSWEDQFRFLFDIPLKGRLRAMILPIQGNNFSNSYMKAAKVKFFKVNTEWEIFYVKEKDIFQDISNMFGSSGFLTITIDEELKIEKDNEFFGFELITTSLSWSSTTFFIKRTKYKNSSYDKEYFPYLIIE